VLKAFADSFKPCWIMALALLAFCLVITVPTRAYSLNRPRGAAAKAESEGAEVEPEAEAEAVERLEAKVAAERAEDKGEPYSLASTPTVAATPSTEKERSRSRERARDEAAL
jgi:hypothetical protein